MLTTFATRESASTSLESKPDAGKVTLLGEEMNHVDEKQLQQLRTRIGFSFQNSALYDSMTVRKNLERSWRVFTRDPAAEFRIVTDRNEALRVRHA